MKASATTAKRKSAPRKTDKLHLDKRAGSIIEAGGGDPDELLSTAEVAQWLGVSVPWLEIGRTQGYGPRFQRLSPRNIRYRRRDVLRFLDQRSHACTAEYERR